MCGGGSSSLQQAPRQQQPFTQITGIENPRPKRMRIATMATFAVLSIQFCMLAQASGKLAGKGQVAEKDPAGAVGTRKSLHPSQEGDREPEVRREPSPWLQKAAEEAGAGGRAHSKAASKPRLGNIQQKASGKKKIPQRPPPKSKSQGLQSHLKGYGKFNTDTYSCPGIQFKACKKPSDCDGCLGLYTCKLPRGKCDLKAVSHETGGFFQSIQNR
ncbi:uncharacterized protein LOC133390351 [Rhineura floridana]|uniref:uncharacterized protein LOC133390351 n=1 Tax=Rhineura floridana TaxID=261503 RepID=UPI002AC7FF2B|nr:uncharacterized protein LOC133390351 [Rhineura floridana]